MSTINDMNKVPNPARRSFVKAGALASTRIFSGGLLVACAVMPDKGPMARALSPSESARGAMPNAWVKVGSDNAITIICARANMGQGTFTSMPMLVAEELNVDITKVRVEMAPAGEPYTNTTIGGQLTGGSTSVREA